MLVDPFTVIAQLVNFALLIWLLSRFLYGPVTRAMEAREARVREQVEGAQRLRGEAEAEGKRYRAKLAQFEAERERLLSDVHAELDALRHEQIREIRAEVKMLRERWRRALEQEKEAFLRGLRAHVARGTVAVMRRALKELADEDLDDRMIKRFLDRLRAMPAAERERLAAAVRAGETCRVRTASPPSDAHRAALVDAIGSTLGIDAAPSFETDPDLGAGVELRVGGLKAAWTLDSYLDGLEEALRDAFHATTETTETVADHVDA